MYCSLPDTFLYYVWRQKPGSRVGERVLGGDERREKNRTWDTASQKRETFRGFANSQETLPLFQRAPYDPCLGEAPCPPTSHQKTAGISNQDGPGRADKRLFSKVWAGCRKVPKNSAVTRVQETRAARPWAHWDVGCGCCWDVGESHGEDHLWRMWGVHSQLPETPQGGGLFPVRIPIWPSLAAGQGCPLGSTPACLPGWGAQ